MVLPILSATHWKIGLAKPLRRKEILTHRKADDEQDRDGNQASQTAIIKQDTIVRPHAYTTSGSGLPCE